MTSFFKQWPALARPLFCLLALSLAGPASSATGKLLATSGLNQLEGSGGGGLTPWATLSGYGSDTQNAVNFMIGGGSG